MSSVGPDPEPHRTPQRERLSDPRAVEAGGPQGGGGTVFLTWFLLLCSVGPSRETQKDNGAAAPLTSKENVPFISRCKIRSPGTLTCV